MEHIAKILETRNPDIRKIVPLYKWILVAVVAIISVIVLYFMQGPVVKDYNVIIVAFDGLQAKHLNAYGYSKDTTPHLDNFFKTSHVFTNTVSPSSWTVPTYMSIFTSLYPSQHKLTNKLTQVHTATSSSVVDSNVDVLRTNTVRLAQILKEAGYDTAAFTGDAGVSARYGYGKGFDTYYETPPFGGFSGTVVKAGDWLQEHREKKFFLFLHGYDVHGQHVPDGGYDYRYVDKSYVGPFDGSAIQQRNLRERGLREEKILLTPESKRFWNAVYDEKISRADSEFGAFIATLKKLGLYDNSILVVLSDHGTEVYEHKKFDHGHTLYSELLNVLLAIHTPSQLQGSAIPALVSTLDVTPTILDLLDMEHGARSQMQGISLEPVLEGKKIKQRPIFSETDYRLYTHKRSITEPSGWKFIITRETGKKELYFLHEDPEELNDLSQSNPFMVYELEKALEKHLISIGDTGPWPTGCLAVYGDQCTNVSTK